MDVTVSILLIFLLLLTANANICNKIKVCKECLIQPECGYCPDPDFKGFRCDKIKNIQAKGCQAIEYTEKKVVANENPAGTRKSINPQGHTVTASPGKTVELEYTVTKYDNYPMDLFILMDLSQSMSDELQMVKDLSNNLISRLNTITKDIQIGFAGFIDKISLPGFIPSDTFKKDYKKKVYTVRLFSALTKSTDIFKNLIDAAGVEGNVDHPEASFDALLQITICKDKIKWRDDARKIVLVITDEIPKVPGLESLARIFNPATEICYIKEDTIANYQQWDGNDMSSPSISFLNEMLIKHEVTPIFAIQKTVEKYYEVIKKYLKDSGAVSGIFEDSDENQFFEFVKQKYEELTKNIKISVPENPKYKVEIVTTCSDGTVPKDNICLDSPKDKSVKFELKITPIECEFSENVQISFPGYGNANIQIESKCDCTCQTDSEPKSDKCSSKGTLTCGACVCENDRWGPTCNCDKSSTTLDTCKDDNTGLLCNNQGECNCGKCDCYTEAYGDKCECRDDDCPTYLSEICGGNGECKCGTCQCKENYTGANCGSKICEKFMDQCNNKDEEVCSNNGKCNCGKCHCDHNYVGEHCEICRTCRLKCENYDKIMNSLLHKKPTLEEIQKICPYCRVHKVESLDKYTDTKCYYVKGTCKTPFVLKTNDDLTADIYYIEYDSSRDCNTKLIVAASVGTLVGILVLLIIIALIAIKVILYIIDRNEYKKFLEERNRANWETNENPLYETGTPGN